MAIKTWKMTRKYYIKNYLPGYISNELEKCSGLSISLEVVLTDAELESLRKHFKYVEPSWFGQTYFSNENKE